MSVDANYIPPECTELLAKITQRTNIGYMAIYLQVIEVNKGDKIVKLVMGSKHERFPVRALLQLAVTKQYEHLGRSLTGFKRGQFKP